MKIKSILLSFFILTCIVSCGQKQKNIDVSKENDKNYKYDSYTGLVMAGYQGWFNTPDDGANRGWYHYKGKKGFCPGSSSVDYWPDVSEYEKTYKTEFFSLMEVLHIPLVRMTSLLLILIFDG